MADGRNLGEIVRLGYVCNWHSWINSLRLQQDEMPGLHPLEMRVLHLTAVGSLFFHGFCLSFWSFLNFQHLYYHMTGSSSVYLHMVQKPTCQGLECITRTSSLALACSLDFPQTCFITANLSGSHWALGWLLVPRPALRGHQGTVSLSVRILPLSVLLPPSTPGSPSPMEQPW